MGYGTETAGHGEFNSETRETQPQSLEKKEAEYAVFEERTYENKLHSNDDEKNVRSISVKIEYESMNFGM